VAAVVGLVLAFSLSSTLVKRAETPGLLLAFWRLVTVSLVWNLLLAATGRRVTTAGMRQVLAPGVFFGLNLSCFFVGATHNSVANAALIGSLAPFLIVPAGVVLFRERIGWPALAFATVAFGGVALVLTSAPAGGDASLQGNVLGVTAMLLLVAYVVSTRRLRRDMDVTTFMATICPIATVVVLPLALADGGVLGMSGTGWTYMLVLAATSGVIAQGLVVYAQGTIQIGTIGIAQVAQPALAVTCSLVLLGEVVNRRQVAGIALVVCGLLAFALVNGGRSARSAPVARPAAAVTR
jgi:drug/metabolite transporter (DMT)-like permease